MSTEAIGSFAVPEAGGRTLNKKEARKAYRKFLRANLARAHNEYVEVAQKEKLALPHKRSPERVAAAKGRFHEAFEAHMTEYASTHSEGQTRAERALLLSKTQADAGLHSVLHIYRKVTGSIGRTMFAAGRKTEDFIIRNSDTAAEHPEVTRWVARFLMGAAITAAVVAAIVVFFQLTPTVAFGLLGKKVLFSLTSGTLFRYLGPLFLSRLPFFQNNTGLLGLARNVMLFGGGTALGWWIAPKIPTGFIRDLQIQSPDESITQTAQHLFAYQIDQKRGSPKFLHIDQESDLSIRRELDSTAYDTDAWNDSPDLAQIWKNLHAFETRSAFLKNDQAGFVREGVDAMENLRTLENASLHGGRGDARFLQELASARNRVRIWNLQFAEAAAATDAEYHKDLISLTLEYANTQPAMHHTVPLNYYLANPATLSEVQIGHGGVITPQEIIDVEDRITGRLQEIDRVIQHYQSASAHFSYEEDEVYRNLINARGEYQILNERMHGIASLVEGMPANKQIVYHPDSLTGDAVGDSEIINDIHQTDFSQYQSAWGAVLRAEQNVDRLSPGQTLYDGAPVAIRGQMSFKEGVHSNLNSSMSAILTRGTEQLKADGYTPTMTEGWKLSDPEVHVSQCHFDGTCVDLRGPSSGREIYTYFKDLDPTARELLLEAPTVSERNHLQGMLWEYLTGDRRSGNLGMSSGEAQRWISQYVENGRGGIKLVDHATAVNWHYEPFNGAAVGPVSLDQEPGI